MLYLGRKIFSTIKKTFFTNYCILLFLVSDEFIRTEHDSFKDDEQQYADRFTNKIFQKKHVSQEDKTTELKTYLYNTLPLDHPKNQESLPPNKFSLKVFDAIRAMMNNHGGIIAVGINENNIITATNKIQIFSDLTS